MCRPAIVGLGFVEMPPNMNRKAAIQEAPRSRIGLGTQHSFVSIVSQSSAKSLSVGEREQDSPPTDAVDHEPRDQQTYQPGDIVHDGKKECLALETLLLIEDDRVLRNECLAGNLLTKHGKNGNRCSGSVLFGKNIRPSTLGLVCVVLSESFDLTLDLAHRFRLLGQRTQGFHCVRMSILRQ